MNLQEYILNEIRELSPSHDVKSAQELFESFPITHIPIVEDKQLIGCISEGDIRTVENRSAFLSEFEHLMDFFFANEKATTLELLSLFATHDSNLVPVLNANKEYLGYFELGDVLDTFSDSPFLHENGVEIIVEKLTKEYAASEITQIVESNNGRVLGLYISKQTSDSTQVVVKVKSEDINEIIQTFRRYNYSIISQYEDDFYLQDLKDRSDYLQKYLDM